MTEEYEEGLYRENIIDHYKNARNFGELKDYDIKTKELNLTCGDQIQLTIKLKDDKVSDVKFEGAGCAVSIASASMLTEKIKGMNIKQLKELNEKDIYAMLGIKLGTARVNCALLSLNTLKKGLKEAKL
ncbi:MAG: SUF system NifU family Fe-S cluster assembly protein [Candidatus Diapherotrites archaeon]|nr:SUF system NifU family Fe-S cluster assembly protein [Candidatus Diapherotrites archaeon]